jgi:hypothetical protein
MSVSFIVLTVCPLIVDTSNPYPGPFSRSNKEAYESDILPKKEESALCMAPVNITTVIETGGNKASMKDR